MTTDIVRVPPEAAAQLQPVSTATIDEAEFTRLWRIGLNLAKSGMFKDVRQGEQAFAKILLGRDLGLSPVQSLGAIYFVKGNLQIAAVTLASFVRRHEGYDYVVIEHTPEVCSIEFLGERGEDGERMRLGVSTFTIADATAAKLVKDDSAWKAHPRNMLFARAMSNGVKWYAPDLLGGIPVYTEADSFTDSTSEDLTAGESQTATARREDLHPDVLAVVERAEALGHRGLANVQAAASVSGASDEVRESWLERARTTLDAMPQPDAEIPEAEVVEADGEWSFADRIASCEESLAEAKADGDDDRVVELEVELADLRAEADANDDPAQERLI
jgi:hypothetical protein